MGGVKGIEEGVERTGWVEGMGSTVRHDKGVEEERTGVAMRLGGREEE